MKGFPVLLITVLAFSLSPVSGTIEPRSKFERWKAPAIRPGRAQHWRGRPKPDPTMLPHSPTMRNFSSGMAILPPGKLITSF